VIRKRTLMKMTLAVELAGNNMAYLAAEAVHTGSKKSATRYAAARERFHDALEVLKAALAGLSIP